MEASWYESAQIIYYCNMAVVFIVGSTLGLVAGTWISRREARKKHG